jgi:tRNA 2-selenouridine synthase SelU
MYIEYCLSQNISTIVKKLKREKFKEIAGRVSVFE